MAAAGRLALAIAVAAAACADDHEKRASNPEELAELAKSRGINGSLILDGVDTDAIVFPALRAISADLWIKVSPRTQRIDLPALQAIGGVLGIYGEDARTTPLEVRVPALAWVGGFVNVRGLSRVTIAFPLLAHCGGLYATELDRAALDFPVLHEFTGALDLERSDDFQLSMPGIESAHEVGVLDIHGAELAAPHLARVILDLKIDNLTRTHLDLSSLDSVGGALAVGPELDTRLLMQTPTIISSTIALGAVDRFGSLELLVGGSVYELGARALDDLRLAGEGGVVRLPQLTTASTAAFLGSIEVDAPRLETAVSIFASGARGELAFPALTEVKRAVQIEHTHLRRIAMPLLASVGSSASITPCDNGVKILRNPELEALDLSALASLHGELWVQLNPQLSSCAVREQIRDTSLLDPACEVLILDNQEACP